MWNCQKPCELITLSTGRPSEVHLLTVESGLDVDKLGRADELANRAGREDTPLLLAYWRLKAIVRSDPEFGSVWWRLSGYAISAGSAALLFFSGKLPFSRFPYQAMDSEASCYHVM